MTVITDLHHVRFRVEDLDQQQRFLEDFGLQVYREGNVLYARGTDATPYNYIAEQGAPEFLGLAFEASSRKSLESIAAIDGVAVEALVRPGGGFIVHLTDPDGLAVDVVYGMAAESLPVPSRLPLNMGDSRPRENERVVIEAAAVTVKRLGHCVINVTDFRISEAWYKQRFGLITSDEILLDDQGNSLGAFMRCNRGEICVDHHTLFLVHAGSLSFNHAAFEISDWDRLMQGHFHLTQKGYNQRWGVGKHILGGQVFDYWKDPAKFTLEHFTDGDLMNESWGSHEAGIEALLGVQWGPEGSP
jgi:catechol 2,3-dioxygenase-like lactoylglutathione lyase family enzyme